MSNLKPCPFCGTTDLLVKSAVIAEYYDETPWIACDHCGFTIKVKELCIDINSSPRENAVWWDKETAEKWNTRPAEDAKDKEIERLKSALHSVLQNAEFWDNEDDSLAIIHRIATDAIGKDTDVTTNAPDINDGKIGAEK